MQFGATCERNKRSKDPPSCWVKNDAFLSRKLELQQDSLQHKRPGQQWASPNGSRYWLRVLLASTLGP